MEEKVIEIVSQIFELSESEFDINANLKEDMGADSMDMLTLVARIENEFKLVIESNDFYSFKTPADIINYVKKDK